MPVGKVSERRPLPELGNLEHVSAPTLLVAGDGDPICPIDGMRNLQSWIPGADSTVLEGTDHFFGRRERELAETIGEWVDRALKAQ
jgi:pimeloyl-ACP methyl ester carboxylesterase